MPRKGDLALCAHGFLGLITSDQTTTEPATAGNIGAEIWTGIQLTNKNGRTVGGPWQSRRPTVIGHSDTLVEIFEKAAKWDETQADREAEQQRLARQREPVPAFVRTGPPLQPRFVEPNPPEPGNLFPPQPYEPVRYAADGLFDGDIDYNGD